ncbi:thioredoxin reductase [Pullulanibacillus camelliae]|uniref:Thioredoxin reductase n=1 Tax=Pullulanibacillus camelliae TaxID=1707096 RepID=A0A8J2YIL1_9BACL|nr:NAD(P)/FAD-dependent oxidoreductase [Pullulanibacillus camelliae]GGE44879.1 thioredoxin reductase [Pullulanibacillus camelliae]
MNNKQGDEMYDVAIIGGGPAGLNAALVLGRSRRRVVVIDEELPRNAVTRESHGFLTRDGITPTEFRRIAKEQILKYPSVTFQPDIVKSVTGKDGDFQLQLAGSEVAVQSRKLLFAMGLKDVLPDINGISEVYGTSAFVCPFCDGWELRDKQISVIGLNDLSLHLLKLLSGWTQKLTLLTDGSAVLSPDQRSEIHLHGIPIIEDKIEHIESSQGDVKRIIFHSAPPVECEGIFFSPTLIQSTDIPKKMGCVVSSNGHHVMKIDTDLMGRTNVSGVYAAGDASGVPFQLIAAASSGATTAAAIQLDLLDAEWNSVQER